MATLNIKNLPDHLYRKLQKRAKLNRRSVAQEVAQILSEALERSDPLLLDLIEQLVKEARRLPLMVVCVARWGFLEQRPNWAGGLADAATLWVEPLAEEHAVRLAMEAGGVTSAHHVIPDGGSSTGAAVFV